MNIVDKSKMCPRCRFTLSKTHSQKMICKRCGYTSNKLQIVQEQDAYDANIRFSRRVNIKQPTPKQQTQSTQNVLEKYLKSFQWLLREVGKKFFSSDQSDNIILRQKLTQTYKNLWFAYLEKIAKDGNVISGVFNAIAQKSNKKNQKKGVLKQQQQKSEQSDNGSDSQKQEKQEKQQKSEQDENSSQNGYKPKQSKRGLQEDDEDKQQQKSSKQKQSNKDLGFVQYKRIINKVTKQLKSLKQPTLTSIKQVFKTQLIPQFLQIAQPKIQNSSFESIVYLAQKYVWFVSFLKQFKGNKKQRPKLQSLINKKWVRQEDLRVMCQERGIQYEKRKLYSQIIVFLYDMLIWSFQQTHKESAHIFDKNETYPYPFLLSLYKNESKQVPLIQKVIKIVQQMSEQAMIKLEQSQKKVPQLSFKFICALIYIASVLNKKCTTVLQAVNAAINILWETFEENVSTEQVQKRQLLILLVKEKNINVRRVRKMAHQVFRFIQDGNSTIECGLNLSGWCQKFSKMFNLPTKTAKEFKLLTQTLYKGHIQQIETTFRRNTSSSNYYVHSSVPQRFILLEQPQLVLSSLLVYLKLKFGLDKGQYPYLINIYEVWNSLKESKMLLKEEDVQKLDFLEKIFQEYKVCDLSEELQELSLLKLLHSVNESVRTIDSYQGLKSISEKSIKKLSQKIRKFRQINSSKEQNKLYLMHGVGNMKENQQKNVVKVQFIKDRKEEEVPELFRYKQFKKKVQLTSIVERSIDYLFEKHKRFMKSKEMAQNQPEVSDQLEEQRQFEILNYIDHPSSNYEIIYHPTINSLYQLKLTQLLVIVQALSLVINGQYTDCKDLLQWMGFLQTALRQFQ